MNFSLRISKRHSPLDDLKFEIKHRKEEHEKKQQRYKKRLATSIADMKYLDRVVLVEGCTYHIDKLEKKTFPTLLAALEYCRKLHPDKVKKVYGNSIRIFIENPKGLDILDDSLIPPGLLVRDCKDALCVYAKERTITVAADLSEVYTEVYDLPSSDRSSTDNIFDYGLLYGNYPVYTGKELCLSRMAEYGENVPFVPETTHHMDNPSAVYDRLMDVCLAYHCYYVSMKDDGSVYDDGDGAYPWAAVPVSTFVNIGNAGVYWPCWVKIWKGVPRWQWLSYNADTDYNGLFRSALLTCKSREVSPGQEYYTITASNREADGLLPANAAGLSLRDSREKLFIHAKVRTIHIAPSFDAVYWEAFELQGEDGQTYHFCFDYALLEANIPEIAAGGTYKTSYWSKARWGNSLIRAEVIVCTLPDADEIYSGQGDIALCCECRLKDEPDTVQKIPVSTLAAGSVE